MTVETHYQNLKTALELLKQDVLTEEQTTALAITLVQEAGKDERQSRIRDHAPAANEPATKKQLDYLELLGGKPTSEMTKSEASAKIEELKGGERK